MIRNVLTVVYRWSTVCFCVILALVFELWSTTQFLCHVRFTKFEDTWANPYSLCCSVPWLPLYIFKNINILIILLRYVLLKRKQLSTRWLPIVYHRKYPLFIKPQHLQSFKPLRSTLKYIYIEDLTWVLMFYWIYQTSWEKEIKCEACRAFYLFFATSLINSITQVHEC